MLNILAEVVIQNLLLLDLLHLVPEHWVEDIV